jgi:hypothetical protein
MSMNFYNFVKEKRREYLKGILPTVNYLDECKEVIQLALNSLHVNPEQTAFFIGDILYNEDMHTQLEMDFLECKKLGIEWLILAGSYGNTDALYSLAMIYREHLTKTIMNGEHSADQFKKIIDLLTRNDIMDLFNQNKSHLSDNLKQIWTSKEKENQTGSLILEEFNLMKYSHLSK